MKEKNEMKEKNKNKNITCPHCGYSWHHRGKLMHAHCPSCFKFFKKEKTTFEKN